MPSLDHSPCACYPFPMKIHLSLIFTLLLLGQVLAEEPLRIWTSTSGKTVEARFEAAKNGKVLLKNSEGWAMSVPQNTLSQEDQAYVAALLNPPAADQEMSREDAAINSKDPDTSTSGEDEVEEVAAPAPDKHGPQLKTFTLGKTTVKGYLSYRFKNGTTAILYPQHRTGMALYHPRLGKTYYMTLGGYPVTGHYSRMVIDDIDLKPPNVRIRYHEQGYPFDQEGYSKEERDEMESIPVLRGELRLTFQPDGFTYTSYAKALVDNAPRHFIHFHVPEIAHNTGFRGDAEAFKKAFEGSTLELQLKASPKKTLEVNIDERLITAASAFRSKYKIPIDPEGYSNIRFIKRCGAQSYGCAITGKDQHLRVATYGHEVMQRRSWIGHHPTYHKALYNYFPHPNTQGDYARMKKDTVATLNGKLTIK